MNFVFRKKNTGLAFLLASLYGCGGGQSPTTEVPVQNTEVESAQTFGEIRAAQTVSFDFFKVVSLSLTEAVPLADAVAATFRIYAENEPTETLFVGHAPGVNGTVTLQVSTDVRFLVIEAYAELSAPMRTVVEI